MTTRASDSDPRRAAVARLLIPPPNCRHAPDTCNCPPRAHDPIANVLAWHNDEQDHERRRHAAELLAQQQHHDAETCALREAIILECARIADGFDDPSRPTDTGTIWRKSAGTIIANALRALLTPTPGRP